MFAGADVRLAGREIPVGWVPGLVVLDIDGTLLTDPAASPRKAVRRAVGRVAAAGVPVVFATGRSTWDALAAVDGLAVSGARLVCSNGAVDYRVGGGVLDRLVFDPAPAAVVLAEALPAAGFAVEVGGRGFRTTAAFGRDLVSRYVGEAALAQLVAAPTSRLACRAYGVAPAVLDAVSAQVRSGCDCACWRSGPDWLDVGPAGVSKAVAVARIADELGVPPDRILAVGDAANDLELFALAGVSVAMGQAAPPVREAATLVTAPVHRDGVAVALSRWFD